MKSAVVAVVALVLGGGAGLLGTGVHLLTIRAGVHWPVGVALALLLLASTTTWLGAWSRRRWSLLVAAIAWGGVCVAAASPTSAGDLLLPGLGRSYAWLGLGSLVFVAVTFTATRPASDPLPVPAQVHRS